MNPINKQDEEEESKEEEVPIAVAVENGKTEAEEDETTSDSQSPPAVDKRQHMTVAADAPWSERMWEVFQTFWPLGLVAFGGPQAHVAILRDHLVVQRDWLDEEQFTELFAIGQVSSSDCLVVYTNRCVYMYWYSLRIRLIRLHLSKQFCASRFYDSLTFLPLYLVSPQTYTKTGSPGSDEYTIGHFDRFESRGSSGRVAGLFLVESSRSHRLDLVRCFD